jgi:hypothetical protein
MFPFAATVATPQPNVPSPGPRRTVTITLQADLPVCGERSAQHAETIFTGPPAMLYLCIHDLPKAVHTDGLCTTGAVWSAAAVVVDPQPGASRQRTAGRSQSCRTDLIVQNPPPGGK